MGMEARSCLCGKTSELCKSAAIAFLLFAVLLISPFLRESQAQSLSITAPTSTVSVPEATDFAASILLNPWDFSERRDIGWEENYFGPTVGVSNGVWSAVNSVSGPYVFPLFGGLKTGLFAEGPSYDRETPRFGVNHPIDTSRFTLLSFKLNQSNRSSLAVQWNNDTRLSFFPDGSQLGSRIDGFYQDNIFFSNQGWQIYSLDLKNLSSTFEIVRGGWTGKVVSLRIDPSLAAAPGSSTQFDWIRLTDPSTGTIVPISWSSSGLSARRLITIYIDNDNSGFDGTPIARFTSGSDPGTYAFNTAVLPAGSYWIYVTSSIGSNLNTEARSGYSGRLIVNGAPSAAVRAPSETSGIEYGTAVRGNPWDMSDASDIANLSGSVWPQIWRQFSASSFGNGLFQAIADPPLTSVGNLQSDAQIHLTLAADQPIDPRRFRYLSYRIGIDESQYPTIADKVRNGWISRPIFWTGGLFYNGPSPKGHIVYEGMKNYSIDLWGSNGGTGLIDQGAGWTSFLSIPNLRIDPLETTLPTWFYFDDVVLTEENRSQNNSYSLRLNLADSDSPAVAVNVFYDTDTYGFDGVEMTSGTFSSGGSPVMTLNTSSWVPGRKYWLYLQLSDGMNTRKQYVQYPIVAERYFPAQGRFRPHLDFDGDGRTDTAVYRPGRSLYLGNGTGGTQDVIRIGGAGGVPVEGDFDGDLRSDYAVLLPFKGSLSWLIRKSSTGQVMQRPWGIIGDVTAIADYNGDMRDDIAVFRSGSWFIQYDNGAVEVRQWGQAGDSAVAGDYDGDNHADVAIWRPADGTWWILNSGFAFGYAGNYFSAIQWGLPGDIPVPFDYDADGRTDLVVWRPSNGTWYIRSAVSNESTAIQWGLPGDIPTYGDFDGDHFNDIAVYRPSTGTWYVRTRSGLTSGQQWGLPGDQVAYR